MLRISWPTLALLPLSAPGDTFRGADRHMHIRSAGATAVWGALCERMAAACGEDFADPLPPTDDEWATLLENQAPYCADPLRIPMQVNTIDGAD